MRRYLLGVEHEQLRGGGDAEVRVRRGRALPDVDAHRLQQGGQEEVEVGGGRVGRRHHHLQDKAICVNVRDQLKGR